jgi:5-formyltetrahydrofolate cyclo-ligase
MDKKQAREIAKTRRAGIVPGDKPQRVADNFFANVKTEGRIIAVYYLVGSELDIFPIYQRLNEVCLSVIVGDKLEFRKWEGELVKNKFGIPEPKGELQKPDIIIVPCLAFNKEKYRLGYGGGFYDRTLPNFPDALKIGVAYAEQELDFTAEPHDVKLDLIVTDVEMIR